MNKRLVSDSLQTPASSQPRIPVGGRVPGDSFVSAPQLKTHLGLLRAFRELRGRVTDLKANKDVRDKLPSLAQQLEPQERWKWFLELALERQAPCNLLSGCSFGLTFVL